VDPEAIRKLLEQFGLKYAPGTDGGGAGGGAGGGGVGAGGGSAGGYGGGTQL
jgi:hypothetical protein